MVPIRPCISDCALEDLGQPRLGLGGAGGGLEHCPGRAPGSSPAERQRQPDHTKQQQRRHWQIPISDWPSVMT
jgi:hypothetical protein